MERRPLKAVVLTANGQGTCRKAGCSSIFKAFFNTPAHLLKDLFKEKHKYIGSTYYRKFCLKENYKYTYSNRQAEERTGKSGRTGVRQELKLEEGIGVREVLVRAAVVLPAVGPSTASLPGRGLGGRKE
jgi:hypothetical protein